MSAKPLHIAVGPRHALLLLPSPLLLLPDNKSGSFKGTPRHQNIKQQPTLMPSLAVLYTTVTEINESVLDPRIGEMVRSLNLGREGEKLFSEANVSFEVLQHLTKDDLQVRVSQSSSQLLTPRAVLIVPLVFPLPAGAGTASLRTVGRVQLHATNAGGSSKYVLSLSLSLLMNSLQCTMTDMDC
jgi:hypothetical protein